MYKIKGLSMPLTGNQMTDGVSYTNFILGRRDQEDFQLACHV